MATHALLAIGSSPTYGTAIWVSLALGAGLALYALDGHADYELPTSRLVRGLRESDDAAIFALRRGWRGGGVCDGLVGDGSDVCGVASAKGVDALPFYKGKLS